MATERFLLCKRCKTRRRATSLFDALWEFSQTGPPACSQCDSPLTLHLRFPFGLDAPDREFTMLKCIAPRKLERWRDQRGNRVTFHPFLVILKRRGRKQAVWFPYCILECLGDKEWTHSHSSWAKAASTKVAAVSASLPGDTAVTLGRSTSW